MFGYKENVLDTKKKNGFPLGYSNTHHTLLPIGKQDELTTYNLMEEINVIL